MSSPQRTIPPSLALAVVSAGVFVAALDQTVVVTVLPSVMLDLKVPITELDRAAWIVTAYLLGYTAAMPLIGRIADVYGYSRVYRASLLVFILGTSLVALAPNLEWMVAARVVQAVGGGATVPIGMAIASQMSSPPSPSALRLQRASRRTESGRGLSGGLALGIVGGAAEAGSMLGPVYGGAIVALFPSSSPSSLLWSLLPWGGWRWIFWLNVPQAALLFLALLWLPNRPNREARVDYLGGALLVAALVALSLALSQKGLFTLASATPFYIGGVGLMLVAALAFYWSHPGPPGRARGLRLLRSFLPGGRQHRGWQPLLAPALFRSAAFLSANLTQLMVGMSLIIGMVTVPLLANTVMGQTPFTGALWLLRMTVPIPIGAVLGGYLLSPRLLGLGLSWGCGR